MADEDCIHCKINALVDDHLEAHGNADLADLAMRIAESLADLIHLAPKEDQGVLLGHAIAHLGDMYVQKGGAGEGDVTH